MQDRIVAVPSAVDIDPETDPRPDGRWTWKGPRALKIVSRGRCRIRRTGSKPPSQGNQYGNRKLCYPPIMPIRRRPHGERSAAPDALADQLHWAFMPPGCSMKSDFTALMLRFSSSPENFSNGWNCGTAVSIRKPESIIRLLHLALGFDATRHGH